MLTKIKIDSIKKEIDKAISDITKREGLEYLISEHSSNVLSCNINIELSLSKNVGKNYEIQRMLCRKVGFTQNVIGMSFTDRFGHKRTISNIKPRNSIYPVITSCDSDRNLKYSVSMIKKELGGDKMINRNANLEQMIG